MKFRSTADPDKALVVVFEPVAAEIELRPGDHLVVEWTGDMGEIWLAEGHLNVGSPMGGDMRVWNSAGKEIPIWGEGEV